MPLNNLSILHSRIIDSLLRGRGCPSNGDLAASMGVDVATVEVLLRELSAIHGVVLHPHVCEPWVIHPFSVTPTPHWIEGERCPGAWAPCLWCAFGVAVLAGGKARIHTRMAGGAEALAVDVRDAEPRSHGDLVVHFAIPPVRAWDNVHQHCALVLPFGSAAEIAEWCARHRQPRGEAVPIAQVADLARRWYRRHADPDWRKWTILEAQQIFRDAGLTGSFWALGSPDREQF
jgi:hypothetical protein